MQSYKIPAIPTNFLATPQASSGYATLYMVATGIGLMLGILFLVWSSMSMMTIRLEGLYVVKIVHLRILLLVAH